MGGCSVKWNLPGLTVSVSPILCSWWYLFGFYSQLFLPGYHSCSCSFEPSLLLLADKATSSLNFFLAPNQVQLIWQQSCPRLVKPPLLSTGLKVEIGTEIWVGYFSLFFLGGGKGLCLWHVKLPGQGLSPYHNNNHSHGSDSARSFTHWATKELLFLLFGGFLLLVFLGP